MSNSDRYPPKRADHTVTQIRRPVAAGKPLWSPEKRAVPGSYPV
jgi:hypothetical protein